MLTLAINGNQPTMGIHSLAKHLHKGVLLGDKLHPLQKHTIATQLSQTPQKPLLQDTTESRGADCLKGPNIPPPALPLALTAP